MLKETQIRNIVERYGLKVDFIDYNIAFRINDTIAMNRNLLKYPNYCIEVLDHEIRHSEGYTKNDLMMDMFEGEFSKNLKFSIKHPKAFFQFIPIGKYNGRLFIDINLMILYAVIIAMTILIVSITF